MARRFLSAVFLLHYVIGLQTAFGQSELLRIGPRPDLPNGAFDAMLDDSHQSLAGINLGQKTISDLLSMLGKAPIVKGDAGAPVVVCYRSTTKNAPVTVRFEAWGSDPNSEIVGFSIVSKRLNSATSGGVSAKCVERDWVTSALATPSGLRLGLNVAEVTRILGRPLSQTKTKLLYVYLTQKDLSASEKVTGKNAGSTVIDEALRGVERYDILSQVEVTIDHGIVTALAVRRTETL